MESTLGSGITAGGICGSTKRYAWFLFVAPQIHVGLIAKHPDVLGIGLDESTAIIVRGQTFEVTGASKIAIHDGRDVAKERQQRNGKKYYFMGPGERYDLIKLQKIGARPATTEQQ